MTSATIIYSFKALIPAGTDISAPVTVDCSFNPASVISVRWRVPPGPSGFMGWQLTSDGAAVIPAQLNTYIVADDESAQWDIQGYPDSGSWQVTGYNNDSFDHSVYLDFLTVPSGEDIAPSNTVQPTAITADNADLSSPAPDTADFTAGLQVPS